MWGYIAAAALPYVVGAMQKKPKRPAPPRAVVLPDRSQYVNQLLQSGFNTDSSLYQQAASQVTDQVNRALAAQGLAGSSIGAQAMIENQNKLQQNFIDQKLQRQQAAMQAVSAIDQADARIQADNNQAAFQYAQDQYNAQLQRQAGVRQGIGQVAQAGANAYYANQAQDLYDQQRKDWMASNYGGKPLPAMDVQAIPPPAPRPTYSGVNSMNPWQPHYGYGQQPQESGFSVNPYVFPTFTNYNTR